MFSRSAWLHLRIPFSYYLLPVFLFSLSVSPNFTESSLLWVFLIVHLLLYPASNGYNSYFDKDEKSIGGLKNPPPVNKGLYYLALLFDLAAIVLGYFKITSLFAFLLLIYGIVSKAYSHPSVRLKKYPVAGWLTVSFFQGFFTFIMCYVGINKFPLEVVFKPEVLIPAGLSMVLLGGTYPMTQIYQHQEDAMRGDRTMSMLLGVRGTFYFVGGIFLLATVAFLWYLNSFFVTEYAYGFLIALSPVVIYFTIWFMKVLRNPENADHKRTMWLNFVSATCLNAFFIYLFLDSTHVLQVFG